MEGVSASHNAGRGFNVQAMTRTSPINRTVFDHTVAVWNHKGGTFKTSIVSNLGYLFASAGNTVLLVDMDPQANLNIDLGITDATDDGHGLADALREGTALPAPIPVRDCLDVICSGPALNQFTDPETLAPLLDRFTGDHRWDVLAGVLEPVALDYDLILIDSGPAHTLLSEAVLGTAHHLIIPTRSDDASISGLIGVACGFGEAAEFNPYLDVLGVVLAGVGSQATRIEADKRATIDEAMGDGVVFDSVIHYSEKVAVTARETGRTVSELADEYRGTKKPWEYLRAGQKVPNVAKAAVSIELDYLKLATEVMERISATEPDAEPDHE